ncbi:MAG TPA: adenylate/guanylate cyclase domain-containing protein, partial [Candidatus Binataceae bacterium]
MAFEETPEDSFDGERKTVTTVFADIKGSMDLIEDLDPEEARAIVDPAMRLMIDAVHRYDGYVVQSTGDGVFAMFGAPAAHEDHAQRALYAGLRMQEEMRKYSARLREKGDPPVEIRVGVNTGEVVVRRIRTGDAQVEYAPVGHATSLASRMQTMAPTGAIVVTQHTHRLTAGYFDFKPLGPTRVKGASEPVEIFEVIGVGPLRTRLQMSATRGLSRFVGRQAEIEHLRKSLEMAREGHGQIVAAVAEAGVGKSRLFHEFKLIAQFGCLVLEAVSVSHGKASSYLPVVELLKVYFRISDQDDADLRREKITGKVFALDRALEDTTPYLFALLGVPVVDVALDEMDPAVRRRRTRDAIKRLILRETLRQPLILIFEDLHWIDEESQALLDLLADSIGTARLLMMVNYRPEYRHFWGTKTYYARLRLDPLGGPMAAEMLSALLGDPPELKTLKEMIIERTEGNPFFMEEMVQVLFDEGVLVREVSIKLARPLASVHVPPTVKGILAARIDRLAPAAKALLQTLAVIGKEFPIGLIRRVTRKPEEDLATLLSVLQLGEFLYEQPAVADS